MIWWLVIIGFLIVAILFIKFEHILKRWKIIVLVIVLVFLFFSVRAIAQNNQIDLKSPSSIINTAYVYFGWLGEKGIQIFDVGKTTFNAVGNVIKGNTTISETFDGRR